MPAIKSSKTSRISKAAKAAAPSPVPGFLAFLVLLVCGSFAGLFFWSNGYSTWYGDAEAHLNIARRIFDSGQPGYNQIGTTWLPLPHILVGLFALNKTNWVSGVAGTIPGVICYALAGTFLFLAIRRVTNDLLAAFAGATVFAQNPNLLYLQSAPMTEPVFFAALCGLLYASVVISQTGSYGAVLLASACSIAASLTRYDGWILIPFVAAYLLVMSPKHKLLNAFTFAGLAALAPLWWLAHNWWFFGDPLDFYHGQWSAKAIYQRALDQGMARYPGDGDWAKAAQYFAAAAQLAVGPVLLIAGLLGAVAGVAKRSVWPVVLLSLPPIFYVLSMHGSGTPIFVPHLWPNSYYNTRYGLAALPLAAFGIGMLVWLVPQRFRGIAAVLVVIGVAAPWLVNPRLDRLICWKESQVNSEARRAWTEEAAAYLKTAVRPEERIRIPFGDTTGILRRAGIPIARTVHEGDEPTWVAGLLRPDLFFWEDWVVCISGDPLCSATLRTFRQGPHYERVKMISVKGALPIEIYRRDTEPRPEPPKEEPKQEPDEDSLHESTRSDERLPADVGRASARRTPTRSRQSDLPPQRRRRR